MLVPLLRIQTVWVRLLGSGPAGRETWAGMAMTVCWTFAQAVTLMSGMLVEEVFTLICPCTLRSRERGDRLDVELKLFAGLQLDYFRGKRGVFALRR